MRILVATSRTNGEARGDYDHCVDGELVYMQEPCATDLRDPFTGKCGCGRGFAGLSSHRATTTAAVVDSALSEAEVRDALESSMEAGGWLDPDVLCQVGVQPSDLVAEALDDISRVASHFPVGSVVRRRLTTYYVGLDLPA